MKAQDLKNSILQLAIQGKLVEQIKEEGAARELIEKIEVGKEKLIKEGKIKKEKELPEITEDEIPFDIPESWEWVRLGNCCAHAFSGKSPKYSKTPNNNIAIGQRNNQNYGMDFTHLKYCTAEFMENYNEEMYLREYDILLNTLGGGTVGRTGLYINPHGFKCITDGHIFVFRTGVITFQKYLYYVLKAYQRKIEKDAEGSTNQSFLKLGNVKSYLVPLPPLEEQKRIVAKIEELMPYVDQYDKAYTAVEELNKKFPEDMQKSILQYAIQGKLVEQREEEGTAEELYQQIQVEKEKLIKEKKIEKIKALPEITEDEISFDIPENWKWVRLGNLISISSGKGLTSKQMLDGNVPVFGGNGITGYHNIGNVNKETVVIGRVGYYCGSVHITPAKAWITDNAFITIYPENHIDRSYLVYILRHLNLGRDNNATAQPVVSGKKIYTILFPLPPLAEQKRIVAKIEEMLPYTKQLIKKID